jgi:undecaprenyl-diphosphatase
VTPAEAIGLGVLQGLTEFLPVSSSGHLRLGHAFFGQPLEGTLAFDVLLHLGTLVAVAFVYRASLRNILGDWLTQGPIPRGQRDGVRLSLHVLAASFPTAVVGLLLHEWVDGPAVTVATVGGLLILNGFLLLKALAPRTGQAEEAPAAPDEGTHADLTRDGLTWKNALLIGLVQGIAVLPGISRSGSTIAAAVWLGVRRERAAELSFLMSIPAIGGAGLLSLRSLLRQGGGVESLLLPLLGAVTAAGVGILALRWLLRLLRQARLHHFGWYCLAVGVMALAWEMGQGGFGV